MHGDVNGNGRAAILLYQEHFSNRRMPNHKKFQRLHRQAYENSSFIASSDGRGRSLNNSRKADLHLMHGDVNGNGRAAILLYQEHFPNRRMLNHKKFQRLHRQAYENSSFIASFDGRGRSRTEQHPYLEEVILDHVEKKHLTQIQRLYHTVGMPVNQPSGKFYFYVVSGCNFLNCFNILCT
ncbi:hypothetical protein TNCV_2792611 [Trichonephila clavipes]|nr:hypothetical protein TNCV_2792611 [Trichonephila clavipes]